MVQSSPSEVRSELRSDLEFGVLGRSCGPIRSSEFWVGVAVRFGVQSFGSELRSDSEFGVLGQSSGSEFWVGVLGRSLVRVRGGYIPALKSVIIGEPKSTLEKPDFGQ